MLPPDEIVPQRFQFNSSQHLSRVPEDCNHFAIDVNRGAPTSNAYVQDSSDNGAKGLPVDLPCDHELRHGRTRVKHH